ncbi:MAG: ABC transporter substrate-binding protein [Calditrichaceae bacterium]
MCCNMVANRYFYLIFILFVTYCSDTTSVVYGIRDFPKSLDPAFGLTFDESQISSQIYENLITLDADCKTLKPHLAKDWKISDDKCTYTLHLHDSVYFHDGTKLSTKSVLATYEWLRYTENGSEIFEKIKKVKIIDSLTFQFVLNEPYSIFLYVLASPESFQLMSENAIKKFGKDIAKKPVGTGPFKLDKWVDNNQIVLKKFENYWGNRSKVVRIIFKYNPEVFELENYLEKSQIDILYKAPATSIDKLKQGGYIEFHLLPPLSLFYLGFNNKIYPFNNIKIRKAVMAAIDLPKLIHTVNRGDAIVAKGPLPPNYYNYENVSQAGYNLALAKKMLMENGLDNITINLLYPGSAFLRVTKIEFLKYQLKKIGIHLNLLRADTWQEFNETVKADSIQMFIDGGRIDILGDGCNFLYAFFYSSSKFNNLNYNEPLVDKWIDEAFLEHDPDKRKQLYHKIVNKILEDTPAVFLSHVIPHLAYNTNKIKKFIANPYGTIRFNKIELN